MLSVRIPGSELVIITTLTLGTTSHSLPWFNYFQKDSSNNSRAGNRKTTRTQVRTSAFRDPGYPFQNISSVGKVLRGTCGVVLFGMAMSIRVMIIEIHAAEDAVKDCVSLKYFLLVTERLSFSLCVMMCLPQFVNTHAMRCRRVTLH